MEKQLFIINEVRTNNFNDSQVADKIGTLWSEAKQYQQESRTFYGIYLDYESDFFGDYTLCVATDYQAFMGAKVMIIPQQKYHVFPVKNDVLQHGRKFGSYRLTEVIYLITRNIYPMALS